MAIVGIFDGDGELVAEYTIEPDDAMTEHDYRQAALRRAIAEQIVGEDEQDAYTAEILVG
jgi:hypothetical protein